MSADTIRNALLKLKAGEATLRRSLSKIEDAAAKARAEASKKREAAARTSSDSSRRMHLRSAESEEKKIVAAQKQASEVLKKLATNAKAQAEKATRLAASEQAEQRTRAREDERRRRKEKEHAQELSRLSRSARQVTVQAPKLERLRLLYLTANPDIADPEDVLRVDAEVRLVKEALKKSLHRDLIQFDHRPAATPEDLIEGINEVRPHVVHFSGHGGGQGIVFDNGSVDAPDGRNINFDVLAEILAATDQPPTVLVLNACDTLDGAEVILPAVPVVIAMSDAVSDLAASTFAVRFYFAIASAQSVGAAIRQGVVGIRVIEPEDATLPNHVAREDVNVETLCLVQPAGET